MARIGIMGGTFDPVHLGHMIIAQQALTQLGLDKIWFMPAGDPPHKGSEVTDKHTRLEMLRLAIADNPDFELFTYEADKERPSYSAVTMTELDELYPENEFYFIMGADSLLDFEKWYRPDIICAHTNLAVAGRNNVSQKELMNIKCMLEEKYSAGIYLIDTPQIEISSSAIRSKLSGAIRNGCRADKPIEAYNNRLRRIRYMLPEPVYKYISQQELYNYNR